MVYSLCGIVCSNLLQNLYRFQNKICLGSVHCIWESFEAAQQFIKMEGFNKNPWLQISISLSHNKYSLKPIISVQRIASLELIICNETKVLPLSL